MKQHGTTSNGLLTLLLIASISCFGVTAYKSRSARRRHLEIDPGRELSTTFCNGWSGNASPGRRCLIGLRRPNGGDIYVEGDSQIFGNICVDGSLESLRIEDSKSCINGDLVVTLNSDLGGTEGTKSTKSTKSSKGGTGNYDSILGEVLIDTSLPDSPVHPSLQDEFSLVTEQYAGRTCGSPYVTCPDGDLIIEREDFHVPAPLNANDPIPLYIISRGALEIISSTVTAEAGVIFYVPSSNSVDFPGSEGGNVWVKDSDLTNVVISGNGKYLEVEKSLVRGGLLFGGESTGTTIRVDDSVLLCEPSDEMDNTDREATNNARPSYAPTGSPTKAAVVLTTTATGSPTNSPMEVQRGSGTDVTRTDGTANNGAATDGTPSDEWAINGSAGGQGSTDTGNVRPGGTSGNTAQGCMNSYEDFDDNTGACAILQMSDDSLEMWNSLESSIEVVGNVCLADQSTLEVSSNTIIYYDVIMGSNVNLPDGVEAKGLVLHDVDQSKRIAGLESASNIIQGSCCDKREKSRMIQNEEEAAAFIAEVKGGGTFCYDTLEISRVDVKLELGKYEFNICDELRVTDSTFRTKGGPRRVIFNVVGSGRDEVTVRNSKLHGTILSMDPSVVIETSTISGQVLSRGDIELRGTSSVECAPVFEF